jgi:hypothetical protein
MKKVAFILLFEMWWCSNGFGQVRHGEADSISTKSKLHYFFSVRSGTLMGCKDCTYQNEISFSSSTIHGIKMNDRWSWGLGTGFNSYSNWQTMPFFLSAAVDLGKKKNRLFAEFNYGYSKAWLGRVAEREYGFKKAEGGRMVQPAIGYKINYHDLRIALLIGYHFQRVRSNYEYPNQFWGVSGSVLAEPNTRQVTQEFNRLLIQMVIGWR